jgi:hypothetical protein
LNQVVPTRLLAMDPSFDARVGGVFFGRC